MNINKILESMKADKSPETLLEAIEELSQKCLNAAAEGSQAEKAYYADADTKKQKLNARVADLRNQLKACDATIESFREPLVAATVSGDQNKLGEIKARMKEQELERSQLNSEISLLESTHVKGSEELYNAVIEKSDAHEELTKEYHAAKTEAYFLAQQKIKEYESLERETRNYNMGGGYGPKIRKLWRHYNSKVPIEEEE